jgi:hypothetical protein
MPPSAKQTLFWIIPLPVALRPARGLSRLMFALERFPQSVITGFLSNILKCLGFVTPEVADGFIREAAGHGSPKMDLTDRYAAVLKRFISSARFPLPCPLTN